MHADSEKNIFAGHSKFLDSLLPLPYLIHTPNNTVYTDILKKNYALSWSGTLISSFRCLKEIYAHSRHQNNVQFTLLSLLGN